MEMTSENQIREGLSDAYILGKEPLIFGRIPQKNA
jgi:hypothetical protein